MDETKGNNQVTNQVTFQRTVIKLGDSFGTTIPKELVEFLGLKQGTSLAMIGQEKSKGRFIAVWVREEKPIEKE